MDLAKTILTQLYLMVVGGITFVGAMYWVFFRDSHFWRYLADSYAQPWQNPLTTRRFQHGITYGREIGSKSYSGILTIGIYDHGLGLRVFAPFSFFHKPLFIPFNEIEGWDQHWYLNAKSCELTFKRAPDVKLVMPKRQAEWLQNASSGAITLNEERSPHNKRPNVWHAFLVFYGLATIALGAYLLYNRFM